MPFGDYVNFQDCVRQNPQARDPEAYCGFIKHKVEDKGYPMGSLRSMPASYTVTGPSGKRGKPIRLPRNKAVRKHKDKRGSTAHHQAGAEKHPKAYEQGRRSGRGDKLLGHRSEYAWHGEELDRPGSYTHEYSQGYREGQNANLAKAVRLALSTVAKAHDPVKEEGDKKLKEAEGVAADGAQDDQAFAVAFGPENYDKLTKRIVATPYREAYQVAGAIVKAIQSKAMNFPGDLEDHLKKAHAAVHGREMWDARYGNVCKLLKQARKLLHDIEKTAEVAAQGGEMPQAVGKADPLDKAGSQWEREERVAPSGGGRPMPTPTVGTQPFKKPRTPGQKERAAAAQSYMTGKASYANKAVRKAVKAAAGR